MKIYLTSVAANVLDEIVPQLPKSAQELSVLFVPTAADPYKEKEWMEDDRNKLKELGFKVTDFDLKEKDEGEVNGALSRSDIVFVAGGNTFYLLEKVKHSGFDRVIKVFSNQRLIYIGSSAGSVILGPNIEPMKYLDDSTKAPLLFDYSGLNFIDYIVLPHFDNMKYKDDYKKLTHEYRNIYKLKPLNDDQFISIEV